MNRQDRTPHASEGPRLAANASGTVRRRCWAAGAVALTLGVCCAAAEAQSNSLLRRGGLGAATVTTPQPSGATPIHMGVVGRPPSPPTIPDAPPPNELLLAVSPIAVEAPKPQRIEVNDLVTIIIRESRTSLNDAKLKSEKDWDMKGELAKWWFRLDVCDRWVPQTFPDGAPGVDLAFKNKYEGKGKYDRKDELTTRITATVIDVKPNGNLVLEARKRIKVGAEVLVATLTGVCRSEDVTPANTVLSTQVADLEIEMPDRGAVRDATRRGWLMRLFDRLRPI